MRKGDGGVRGMGREQRSSLVTRLMKSRKKRQNSIHKYMNELIV